MVYKLSMTVLKGFLQQLNLLCHCSHFTSGCLFASSANGWLLCFLPSFSTLHRISFSSTLPVKISTVIFSLFTFQAACRPLPLSASYILEAYTVLINSFKAWLFNIIQHVILHIHAMDREKLATYAAIPTFLLSRALQGAAIGLLI